MSTNQSTTGRTCAFCGSRGDLSREHIFPKWLQPYVPGEGTFTITRASTREHLVLNTKTWETSGLDERVRAVCTSCNNGWMSKLEAQVKLLLVPALQGGVLELNDANRVVLARWAVKTGIVINAWQGNTDDRINPDVIEAVMNGVLHPSFAHAWIGRREPAAHYLYVDHAQMDAHGAETGQSLRLTTATFSLGPMLFQTIFAVPAISLYPGIARAKLVRLWPLDGQNYRWQTLPLLSQREVRSLTPGTPESGYDLPLPGRNDPCPCGSGEKTKRCHPEAVRASRI